MQNLGAKVEKYFAKGDIYGVSGMFSVDCDLGHIDGAESSAVTYTVENNSFIAKGNFEGFCITSKIIEQNGVFMRQDTFENKTDKEITLYKYLYRFVLEGGNNEVYTQYSSWKNESEGSWQKLISNVSVKNTGLRMTEGGTPFAAIWNNSCKTGTAFNLLPISEWTINISKRQKSMDKNVVVAEMGINDSALRLVVAPKEKLEMPEVIFYVFHDKTSMESYKLHQFVNTYMPRKEIPVVYNTWFLNFENIDFDEVYSQIEAAKDLGFEYFVLDSGWFGEKDYFGYAIGEWFENQNGGFYGRMIEIAESVKKHGMKFGLWLEAERALTDTKFVREYPQHYFKYLDNYFIKFYDSDARDFITSILSNLIEKYGVELIKFDFNFTSYFDESRSAFYRYHLGFAEFMKNLKKKYPNVYMENCASGGTRMELGQMKLFDSVWFSDNQNPYDGMRIYRDTLLRMSPAMIEKWGVLASIDGFVSNYATQGQTERLMTVGCATWNEAETVSVEYMKEFLTGGPFGLTCNLCKLSDAVKIELKKFISEYKKERDFYKTAVCRVLAANDEVTILQFSDFELKKNTIQVFAIDSHRDNYTIYPKVNADKAYIYSDNEIDGEEVLENGICISIDEKAKCASIMIIEKN